MPDLANAAKPRLQSALAELEARLTNVVHDLDEPADPDLEEQSIEVADDEALEHQAQLISREIASVKGALARIDEGSYGICVRCGGEIAAERLEARPEAALCIHCARTNG